MGYVWCEICVGYVWREICVGYVWCEIRQQSSEEPCDETSFGNNNQPPVFELIRVAFPKKNQGQKNCFYFFSRRNYHGPWNSNRFFCRFMLVEWFRNTTFIPFYIYKVFIHPKGGCLGFLPYESHCFSKFFCKQKSPLFWVEDREASHKMMYTWAPSAVWP